MQRNRENWRNLNEVTALISADSDSYTELYMSVLILKNIY